MELLNQLDMTMRVGSLFTGYGGLDIAVGGELAWYAEIEPAACQVLAHHYPNVTNLGDITKINWADVEPVDIITGGYPCQPFSHAGNRKGKNDERHLWPNVFDAIRAIRPRYAILENVSGHRTLGFTDVLADLAEIGWSCEWGTFRASDVGAPHRRDRIFIVAYANSERSQGTNAGLDLAKGRCDTRGHAATGLDAAVTNTSGDGHGQQLHAGAMAGVEGQAESSTQQRKRSRRKSDPRGVVVVANAEHDGSHGRKISGSISPSQDQGLLQQSKRCDPDLATDTDSPSSKAFDGRSRRRDAGRLQPVERGGQVDWGKYGPAIRRWETILERAAPAPTTPGRNDRPRLNPQFVEWMMGLPEGWVTGHGLSAAKELKMLGNGVVPQQAHAAITQLLERTQQ